MTIALAVICVAILLAVILTIILCRRNRKEKERLEHKNEWVYATVLSLTYQNGLNPLPVISVASARICCERDRRIVFQAGPTEGVLKILQDRPHGYKERWWVQSLSMSPCFPWIFLPSFLTYWFRLSRRSCQHDKRIRSQCGPSSQSSFLLANRITCPDFIKLIKAHIVERQRETKFKLRAQIWKLWATLQGLFQFHSS